MASTNAPAVRASAIALSRAAALMRARRVRSVLRPMRRPLLLCACVVLAAGPTVLAFASGGYFERPRLVALAAAAVTLAVVALAAPCPLPRSTAGRAALG